MQSNHIIASLFSNKLELAQNMMQSNQNIASLFSFEFVQKMTQSNQIIAHYFQTSLNLFKRWCNQAKLLHHFFWPVEPGLTWAGLGLPIKQNYGITIFKHV